jgi:hypothetical protein
MKQHELQASLRAHPRLNLTIALPDGRLLPAHAHVTEVGHVKKTFVDCGGTFRVAESCVLQVWIGTANDDGHRLAASKLAGILEKAQPILPSADLPVEIEYEDGAISQYPLESVEKLGDALVLRLASKHTDCLAKDLCGVPAGEAGDDAESGCCGPGCCG